MSSTSNKSVRPRADEQGTYPWNIGRVPETLELDGETVRHPGRSCGVFVVHGIGEQAWAETAAILRSGFEDALDAIRKWEGEQGVVSPLLANERYIPPPYIAEGFWADYSDFKKTFKDDWEKLTDHARVFFEYLWKLRSLSLGRTYIWFFSQQFRLLRPSVLKAVGIRRWLLYIPFQMLSLAILTLALLRYPRLISGFLADVRLYLDPKGLVENVIVQRIDQRVGEKFLLMIGLDWEFRPLPDDQLATEMGVKIRFDRVVWVAHSLGSVISYNVLSDLFHRAVELGQAGDAKQQEGVKRFREALSRFITIGSPLDKVAFLFGHRALKPWPSVGRDKLLYRGDTFSANDQSESREWWINFYSVLDPVSGELSDESICGDTPPANFHIRSGFIPGAAHVAYWKDIGTLRYILGRTYGGQILPDRRFAFWAKETVRALRLLAYSIWTVILVGGTLLVWMGGVAVIRGMLEQIRNVFPF